MDLNGFHVRWATRSAFYVLSNQKEFTQLEEKWLKDSADRSALILLLLYTSSFG